MGQMVREIALVPLGVPGSGKGTIGKLLAKGYGVPHVSTGDMLRALPRDSELGKQVWPLVERGELVADHLINTMVSERLARPDVADGVVLDGYPRTQAQVDFLDTLDRPVQYIELALAKEVAVSRLLRRAEIEGRSDDTPDVIAHRFTVYDRQTQPLLDKLTAEGRLIEVQVGEADAQTNAKKAAEKIQRESPLVKASFDPD